MRKEALCVLACALLAGCQSFQETAGEVSVSRPQVFTRERLVNERLGEVNWLREQLDKPFEQGFQGFRDVREAAAFVLEVKAKYDRALRRTERLAADDRESERERTAELAQIEHDIRKLGLEQQLDALRKSTGTAPPSAPVPSEVDDALKKLGASVDALSDKIATLESKLTPGKAAVPSADMDKLFQGAQGRVLNPKLAERTAAGQTSRDRLEDEAAYRDFVNGRIREASLDDTHDLNGFALYELKFDATIVPGSHTRRQAIAELAVTPEMPRMTWEQIVRESRFAERLSHRIQEDVNALIARQQERVALQQLSRAWRQRIVNSRVGAAGQVPQCLNAADPDLSKNLSDATSNIARNLSRAARPKLQLSSSEEAQNAAIYSCLIAEYVRQRLHSALGSVFQFELVPAVTGSQREPRVSVKFNQADPTAVADLVRRMKELSAEMKPWVATVAPKEYAQSISDVASHQQIRQIGALLGASDGNAAAVDARVDAYKQSQQLAQAIKRQPLAASFVRGDSKFGWVLGPKYEIKGSRPDFVQGTSRYTFTASVAVPGWHDGVILSGCGYWVESDGSRSAAFSLFDAGDCSQTTVKVRLPANHRAVFHALLGANLDIVAEPEIRLLSDADPKNMVLALRAMPDACGASSDKGCEQLVVIEGSDLWRNPAVFIGNQRADRVDVLPSMRGIVATFKSLRAPAPGRDGRTGYQDLFVSTSAGQDRLEDVVFIGAGDMSPSKPFAKLASPILELTTTDSVDIAFRYLPSAFPRAYSAIALRVRRSGTAAWKLVEAEPRFKRGELVFTVPGAAALGFDKKSGAFDCDLVFKFVPGDDWISMTDPSGTRAMYYANKAERELSKIAQANADFSSVTTIGDAQVRKLQQALHFALPVDENLFFQAYPGLQDALAGRGGGVSIELQPTGDAGAIAIAAERVTVGGRTQIRASFSALHARALDLVVENEQSITYSLGVSYRRGSGEPVPVAMTGGAQLTVKGTKTPSAPAKAAAPEKAAE